MAMCAGVQKVSRPIVRCQEMSHNMPMAIKVPPARTARAAVETVVVRAGCNSLVALAVRVCIYGMRLCRNQARCPTSLRQMKREKVPVFFWLLGAPSSLPACTRGVEDTWVPFVLLANFKNAGRDAGAPREEAPRG